MTIQWHYSIPDGLGVLSVSGYLGADAAALTANGVSIAGPGTGAQWLTGDRNDGRGPSR